MSDVKDSHRSPIRLLAVASGGGHWEQLMLLRPTFERFSVSYATTDPALGARDGIDPIYAISDSNRNKPFIAFKSLWQVLSIMRKTKPDVIVSTGSMPGLLCLMFGRLMGKRTIWVDSVANSERMSMSGTFACRFVTVALTQWEHLARPNGPKYFGALL
jgi:UDP-N-acetylglucosamine:LPS N-acetylglucosamine transferase